MNQALHLYSFIASFHEPYETGTIISLISHVCMEQREMEELRVSGLTIQENTQPKMETQG